MGWPAPTMKQTLHPAIASNFKPPMQCAFLAVSHQLDCEHTTKRFYNATSFAVVHKQTARA
jgi:hypothetical protein